MYEHIEKSQKNKSRAVANSVARKKSAQRSSLGGIDNAHKTIEHRKFQGLGDNRSQTMPLPAFQEMADNNQRIKRTAQLQAMANGAAADPAAELLSVISQLEHLATEANAVEDHDNPAPGMEEFLQKIMLLKDIAAGKDGQKKSEALHALKTQVPGGQVSAIEEKPVGDTQKFEAGAEPGGETIQQKSDQPIQRDIGLTAGLAIGGAVLGIAALARGIVWFVRRRRRRQQQAIFEEFGDEHRRSDFDPDRVGEAQNGIHVAVGDAARPEDAPIVNYFRTRFHKLHSAKLYLEQNHPHLITGFENQYAGALNNLTLKDRLIDISGQVKDESKAHKKRIKDLNTNTAVNALDDQYRLAVEALGDLALTIADHIRTYINTQTTDQSDIDQIHAEGTDIWRATWLRAIMAVNTVLHGRWPHWKGRIKNWIRHRRDTDNLNYMDPGQVIGLEYIGSLARGYKGPPKQGVRFMPEKFDVDANLSAPPLAAYALAIGHAIIDRGRIWSQRSGPALYNGLIQPMENDIQQRLVNAGLIQMGMDPNEPFEVVIDAEGVQNLPNVPAGAVAGKAQSEKDLRIRNKLHTLRSTDRQRFQRVGTALRQANFTHPDNGMQLLKEHNEQNQSYAFTDLELNQIEDIIDTTP